MTTLSNINVASARHNKVFPFIFFLSPFSKYFQENYSEADTYTFAEECSI